MVGIGNGYVMPEHQISTLIGRLLTLIEALGLKELQEKSIKELVKQEVWGNVRDMQFIQGDLLTTVINIEERLEQESKKRDLISMETSDMITHRTFIKGDYEISFIEKE